MRIIGWGCLAGNQGNFSTAGHHNYPNSLKITNGHCIKFHPEVLIDEKLKTMQKRGVSPAWLGPMKQYKNHHRERRDTQASQYKSQNYNNEAKSI